MEQKPSADKEEDVQETLFKAIAENYNLESFIQELIDYFDIRIKIVDDESDDEPEPLVILEDSEGFKRIE
tara:strand:- start:447 stop:656 length:210 start_codon:yes stop_codon:yes gene_type:complete